MSPLLEGHIKDCMPSLRLFVCLSPVKTKRPRKAKIYANVYVPRSGWVQHSTCRLTEHLVRHVVQYLIFADVTNNIILYNIIYYITLYDIIIALYNIIG